MFLQWKRDAELKTIYNQFAPNKIELFPLPIYIPIKDTFVFPL